MATPVPLPDSVTETNVKVLGDAPEFEMSSMYQTIDPVTAEALANAANNATSAQQQADIAAQAVSMGMTNLYSIDTAADGVATTRMLSS